jgi:hypothetical protein
VQQHGTTGRASAHRIHPLVKNMPPILACGTGQAETTPRKRTTESSSDDLMNC